MHTIVVMRHAKAQQTGPSDHERALAPRGHEDAAVAGRWLADAGIVPEYAWVSDALRARETWGSVASAAGWAIEPEFEPGLYTAGPESALDFLRLTPETAGSVLLLGHNPTVAYVAQLLDDGEGDTVAGNEMAMGYPTNALTVFEYDGAWADLGTATLRAFHVGRA